MARFNGKRTKLNITNFVFYVVCVLVCTAACLLLFNLNITHAVALEQEIRCGIEEHTHKDSCYDGDIIVCEKTAHTHDGNCYIVLLKENNINEILSLLGNGENHSLEHIITDTVTSALTLNANINTPEDNLLSKDIVEELNTTISGEDKLPDIVLNENITLADKNVNAIAGANGNAEEIVQPSDTSSYKANFYIYLDGKWTCIGTLDFAQTSASSNRYNGTIPTEDVLELVNGALGTEYAYNSFDIAVSTSQNGTYTKTNLGMASVTTTVVYRENSSNVKRARHIRLIPEGGNATSTSFRFYTVTFNYPDGSSSSKVVRSGTAITLPGGNYEWSSGNTTYDAGEAVTISNATTFNATQLGPVTYVRIDYDVAFPTVSGVTIPTKPTLAGLSVTTTTDGFNEGSSATVRNVSQQSVEGTVNNNSTGLTRVVQFRGWKVEGTDVILQPNTGLVWEELLSYAKGGRIKLTAVWQYDPLQTASFFIRFDSVAVDTEGNITGQDSNKYTKQMFAAFVGGVDVSKGTGTLQNLYGIADTTADNSYGADQKIRALYGERTDGVWLSAFPSDDYIFASLVQYANTGYLSVDGVPVKAEDLNDREYAIRWYVFKSQSDAWHIDGKLVRKEGLIHVYKTFAGNKQLIAEAKKDFYIDAIDVTTGVTTVLDLDNYKSYEPSTDTYMWEITNVDYGELWEITEHPHLFEEPDVNFGVYSEYTVMDAHGNQSISGRGTSLTVKGMTYALDEGVDEVLRAEFTNIYNKSDSIVIKKQDALTGVSIGGATFRLMQNGAPLKFNYDSVSDSYEYDPENGTHTVLSGTENGYFEISIHNFSYDMGNIVIQEVTAPQGYSPIGNIEIGYVDDDKTVGIISGNSEMIKYFGGVLIVGNSTDAMSVEVKKNWDCPENEWQPVTIQLLANGKLVTTVIAGVEPYVVLSAENNWQYLWENLPIYVNGTRIEWSVKETVIGNESAKADGSFVNWLVSYGIPIQSTDENGDPRVSLTVTNTTKRVMLRLTKTDIGKSKLLSGAEFLLEAVDASGNVIPNEIAKTAVTGNTGTLTFDNLKCKIRYRLTEKKSPDGYLELTEYIYFTINEDGSVSVEESYYAEAGGTAYNITVRNAEAIPLPESGSMGTDMFYTLGLSLILLSAGMYIYHLRKRRCQN